MVVGIAGLSIVAGRLVSKTGRYKVWPIAGAVILVIGMFDLAHLHTNTPYWQIALGAFIVGTGLGFTMQTLMVAVQNDVEYRDMGTATSGITFFRQIGSALGVALLGSILSSRLVHYLGPAAPGVPAPDASKLDAIKALPEPVKGHVLAAFSSALDDVFLVAIPFVVIALVVALFLKEIPLRSGHASAETPTDTDMDVVAATH
jgi:MFS family permease